MFMRVWERLYTTYTRFVYGDTLVAHLPPISRVARRVIASRPQKSVLGQEAQETRVNTGGEKFVMGQELSGHRRSKSLCRSFFCVYASFRTLTQRLSVVWRRLRFNHDAFEITYLPPSAFGPGVFLSWGLDDVLANL